MKIKMLKTRQGSPDGVTVNSYRSGETVDVPDELAHAFVRQGWARKLNDPGVKDEGKTPENKKFRKKL